MESPIVTLTTDWGYQDFFAGMVKGKLMNYIPNVRIVDICHGISPFDKAKAAYVVKNGCLGFPPGTIHIIDVDTVETEKYAFVVVEYKEQYYICTDNSLPSEVFGKNYTSVTQLRVNQESNFFTFGAYDLFCKVAALIAAGTPLSELGEQVNELYPSAGLNYLKRDGYLKVYINYIDVYGNVYLSITYDEFMKIRDGRDFSAMVNEFELHEISNSYNDSADSRKTEILLTVSSTGYLQIAIRQDSAEHLLGLKLKDSIIITFK